MKKIACEYLMKSKVKIRIAIIITSGILFAFSNLITANLNFNIQNIYKNSEQCVDITGDNEYLKLSKNHGLISQEKCPVIF